MTPDLVIIGNLLLDDVVHDDGHTRMGEPGGAALYGCLAASLWDARVGCLSVACDDYPQAMLDALAARGVALDGVRALAAPSLRTWLLYERGGLRRVVHRLGGTPHEAVSPGADDLPVSWRAARAFHLAPMPLDLQARWLANLTRFGDALLSVDPYELLTPASRERWVRVLARCDVFLPSEDDVVMGDDPLAAVGALASGRLNWIACKRGARGGMVRDLSAGHTSTWAPRAERVVDPTGAGDAFAAGVLTALATGAGLEAGLQRGVVGASFAIADWGAAGLLAATPAQAQARLAAWFPSTAAA